MSDRVDRPERPVVTVLTPVFNEEAGLAAYEREVTDVLLSRADCEFRVLFIDDGSTDRSWEIIRDICNRSGSFSGIRLSRNFGSHVALSAGFLNTSGDAVATLACDLQDPQGVILEFVAAWRSGAAIVWGHRRVRDEEYWRVLSSKLFAFLIRRYAMPKGSKFTTGSFLLVDKAVAECIRQYPERNRTTFALVAWTGFDQQVVGYDRRRRQAGISGWSYGWMISALYDTFIGFSFAPIRMMTITGVGIFLLLVPYVVLLVHRFLICADSDDDDHWGRHLPVTRSVRSTSGRSVDARSRTRRVDQCHGRGRCALWGAVLASWRCWRVPVPDLLGSHAEAPVLCQRPHGLCRHGPPRGAAICVTSIH